MSEIYGLISVPNGKDYDLSNGAWIGVPEIADEELTILRGVLKSYSNPINIMEIGIFRNEERSFTANILKTKQNDSKYLGIDLLDKSLLNNEAKHIYTLKTNSFNQEVVRSKLKELNMDKLHILLIDGDHSIEGCVNDWKYSNVLSDDGTVIIHDTASHVGPKEFIRFIDPEIFNITEFSKDSGNGITVAVKRQLK